MLSGHPTGIVVTDSSVQLTATPLDAAGQVLADKTVSWTTSDASIATVTPGGLVRAVGVGVASVTAKRDAVSATAMFDVRAGGVLTSAGGTLVVLDGRVTLILPEFGVPVSRTVAVSPLQGPAPLSSAVPGTAFEIGPTIFSLQRLGVAKIRYDVSQLPPGADESTLQLYSVFDGRWQVPFESTVDLSSKVVTGVWFGSGRYVVAATPVANILLRGGLVSGALYVGGRGDLLAQAVASNGDVIPSVRFHWTSSNPSVAHVDDAGHVDGVASGTTTLTVTGAGATASTTVRVLPSPIPPTSGEDLSSEWPEYHGSARHAGAIETTLNPVQFREIWSTAGFTSRAIIGGGRVYGISGSHLWLVTLGRVPNCGSETSRTAFLSPHLRMGTISFSFKRRGRKVGRYPPTPRAMVLQSGLSRSRMALMDLQDQQ